MRPSVALAVLLLSSCMPFGATREPPVAAAMPLPPQAPVHHWMHFATYRPAAHERAACMPEPGAPQNLNDHSMGLYIAALIQAGDDCRAKAEER
jgi:hypothetical protein